MKGKSMVCYWYHDELNKFIIQFFTIPLEETILPLLKSGKPKWVGNWNFDEYESDRNFHKNDHQSSSKEALWVLKWYNVWYYKL